MRPRPQHKVLQQSGGFPDIRQDAIIPARRDMRAPFSELASQGAKPGKRAGAAASVGLPFGSEQS